MTVNGQKLILKANIGGGEVLQGDKLVLTMMDEDWNEVTDATIYYSTDGSAPTEQSEVYTTPIVLEKSFTLRAIDKVTFSAKGATVKISTDVNTIGAGSKGVFRPTFRTLRSSTETACLNSVNDLHKATGGETEGSRFITNLRKADPFEAVFEQVPAGTRSFGIDIVSGIEETMTPDDDIQPSIYNLKGQRVRTMQRGQLYIVDGKKYVRK